MRASHNRCGPIGRIGTAIVAATVFTACMAADTTVRAQATTPTIERLQPLTRIEAVEMRELLRELRTIVGGLRARVPSITQGRPGYVQGRLFTGPKVKTGTTLKTLTQLEGGYPVPGLEVRLVTQSGTEIGPFFSDLTGRFRTQMVGPGNYTLCVKGDGYIPFCRDGAITVHNKDVNLLPMGVSPQRDRDSGTLFGRVMLKDDSFPMIMNLNAGITASARVTAFDRSGNQVAPVAIPNSKGDYVLPMVPVNTPFRVVVELEKGQGSKVILPGAFPVNAFSQLDLTIDNSRPKLNALAATFNGKLVSSAEPSEVVDVRVRASDPDGDPVKLLWVVNQGDGVLSSNSGPAIKWELPKMEGLKTLRVIAYDGKGGYAEKVVRISSSRRGARFTGFVSATDMPAVPNATVEVNGQTTVTNADGFFKIYVKEAERYVLNIRSSGHGLFSQIFDRPVRAGRFVLTRATRRIADPRGEIIVIDQRTQRDCRGRPSASLNWKVVHPLRRKLIVLDGKGGISDKRVDLPANVSPLRARKHDCGPGISIRIPANSLVDADGNPPTGNVEVALVTYDIEAAMAMPGDYTVAKEGQIDRIAVMETFGAGGINVTAGGKTYNLLPGATAKLRIPVAPNQIAAGAVLPPQIPILHYDEVRGVWNETGTAQLQGTTYVTEVKHFSSVNADVLKTEQSCVHVSTSGENGAMPNIFNIEVTIPMGAGSAPRIRTLEINRAFGDDHSIINLPNDKDIILVPYDIATQIPFGTFIVNSGGTQTPTNPAEPVDPEATCANTAQIFIPDEPRPLPGSDVYLQGLFSFAAINLQPFNNSPPDDQSLADQLVQASQDYYVAVDPRGLRTNFTDFKNLWGFDATAANGRYTNSADLGFGRDMHCTTQDLDGDGSTDVACFVSNYGNRENPDLDDANAAAAQDPDAYVASVTMEFAPIENPDPAGATFLNNNKVVKFFVYGGDDNLATAADLDLIGPRPVPQLCMVCHGGRLPNQTLVGGVPVPTFQNAADVNLESRFIPFDLPSYTFADSVPGFDKASQQAAFKDLNENYVTLGNPSTSTLEIIDEYYNGGASPVQIEGFSVDGWGKLGGSNPDAGHRAMYENVVGTSCRLCHQARDNTVQEIMFDDAVDLIAFGSYPAYLVCTERTMPHSFRTYERFWTSLNPHWPAQFKAFGDVYAAAAGGYGNDCVFPPNNGQPSPFP